MRIIDTNRKSQAKSKFAFIRNLFLVVSVVSLSGCIHADFRRAQEDAGESRKYYQRAVNYYRAILKTGRDPDRAHFELGRLYFEHGDFQAAKEALKNTGLEPAEALLAIAEYRLTNFTDALEIFNKLKKGDPEHLFYHGATCEKLNLFDEALEKYRLIKEGPFALQAQERIAAIEKSGKAQDISLVSPQTHKIIAQAPDAINYPQAGALVLRCDENIEISSTDTQVSTLHYVVKILNERGKEKYSETGIDYDSTYEKVELEFARTITPEGKVVDVGSRHIRDVTKYMNYPLYSNARVFIISFPEIAEGSSIEYKVKIYRSRLINKKDVILAYSLQGSEPLVAGGFSITVAKDKKLNLKVINEEYNDSGALLSAQTRPVGANTIYSWSFSNIPQIIPESNMPATSDINPTILISTFKSWQDIYEWWWQLAKERLAADDDIKSQVALLTKGLLNEEEKAAAIYNFCAQDIRYVAVEYGQAGHQPHYAYDIFRNKYGDCKDQAILLVTMLRQAGLRAWPVLIATREYYNLSEDFPALFFNHAIACVELNDEIIFMDPTASTCSFRDLPAADQGRNVLIIKETGYQILPTPLLESSRNLVKHKTRIKIDAQEGICAQKKVTADGVYAQQQRYWLLYTPPDIIADTLRERIQGVSIGANLINYDTADPGDLGQTPILSYSFCGPEYFIRAGHLRLLPQLADLETIVAAKDRRRYPIDLGILDTREGIFDIEIPSGFVVQYMPDSLYRDSRWLTFSAQYRRLKNRIFFRQKMRSKKISVSVQEYPEFKEFFQSLARDLKQRVVLEKK